MLDAFRERPNRPSACIYENIYLSAGCIESASMVKTVESSTAVPPPMMVNDQANQTSLRGTSHQNQHTRRTEVMARANPRTQILSTGRRPQRSAS